MFRLFRHLLTPTPTSPFDPYRGRRDNRTTVQKVVSGMRLGGGLVAGFLVVALALGGLSTLPAGAPAYGRYGVLVSWGMLCVGSIIMFWTANRWAPFVPGFFCVPALLKILGMLLVGPNQSSSTSHRITRIEAAELLAVFVIVTALTWRFVGNRPAPTTLLDRLALTFFVLATLKQMAIPYHWPPLPLISALSALLISWSGYRWERNRRSQKVINAHVDG